MIPSNLENKKKRVVALEVLAIMPYDIFFAIFAVTNK